MPASQTLNTSANRCTKCCSIARHGYPLTRCSGCNKLFHVKCLYKISAGNNESIMLCTCCKQKRMSANETTTNIARLSSAVTKTTARRSATTSKHISSANKDVRRVSGTQAPSKISTFCIPGQHDVGSF